MKTKQRTAALLGAFLLLGAVFPSFCVAQELLPDLPKEQTALYCDVSADDWFYDDVLAVTQAGLFQGDNGAFLPYARLSRAMAAQLLYRCSEEPVLSAAPQGYSDVAEGAWYYEAVCWLTAEHIAEGYDDGTFRPQAPLTREQLAVLLYHYERQNGLEGENKGEALTFSDAASIHSYALDAMDWAVSAGILRGSGTLLRPNAPVTRAEAAAVFHRWMNLKSE